jgi:ATP-dependent RNA circularization protein (DNA/RNA ligase family)
MTEYHKINAIFKRYMDGPQKGRLIEGDWASPEFGYLADNQWEFTEKVDGTNIRIEFHNNGLEFKGRTDNASIPTPLMAHLEKTFVLEDMLPHFDLGNSTEVTLYGEGYGPKIQNGGLYRQDVSFVLFDVKIGDFWLTRPNVNDIADKLGIDSVPVLGTGTIHDAINIVKNGLESRWSTKTKGFEAEGIVARPVVPLFNRKGERIIAKIKARDFR